jgi:hypothetical protein
MKPEPIDRSRRRALALALGVGLLASAASGWQREAALSARGDLYTVKPGVYGELFPEAPEALAANPVLALEVMRADGPTERLLVPGTEDAAAERTPMILFEESSNSAFLVWETSADSHPLVKLARFDGARFAELAVPESVRGLKSAPQIAITRDSYTAGAGADAVAVSRTILHLVCEEEGSESTRTLYLPLILENGEYIGYGGAVELNRLDESPAAGLAYNLSPELVRSPSLQPGRDGRTVVAAFADAQTRRVVSVEIRVLPRDLSRLADIARNVIIDTGARLNYPQNLSALADRAREAILGAGGTFQPEVVQAMANRVADEIRAAGGRPLQVLAGVARNVIIDTGARLSGPGLRNQTAAATAGTPQILEIERQGAVVEGLSPSHLIQLSFASSRPAPRVQPGDVTLMTSPSGEDVLIALAQDGRVLYRDSKAGGWNDARELKLTERIDLGRALTILYERIRDR